jgi:MFS family permease
MAEFEHRYASTVSPCPLRTKLTLKMNDPISKGMLTAILELGAFLAAMVAGPISDRYSRKVGVSPAYPTSGTNRQYSISAWCIVFMLGVALQVGANNNVGYIYGMLPPIDECH